MLENLRTNKILWFVTIFLTLIAAIAGIIFPHIYNQVIAKQFLPGALPQDILTVCLCIFLFYLIVKIRKDSVKLQSLVIGIMGSFFYLYGIFTIERVYNLFYILYLAIFACSFWSIIYSLIHVKPSVIKRITLSSGVTRISAGFALVIAVFFTFLWTMALIPLMQTNNRIEFLYSIYILDLVFVMPAFFITSILSFKRNPVGVIFLPSVYIVGFFVIFPLGLGELAKPFYNQVIDYKSLVMSFVFSLVMLSIGLVHLAKIIINSHFSYS